MMFRNLPPIAAEPLQTLTTPPSCTTMTRTRGGPKKTFLEGRESSPSTELVDFMRWAAQVAHDEGRAAGKVL